MILDWAVTLTLLAAGLGLFGFATWRARQPPQPLKVRMVNYHYVQFLALLFILLAVAHVITLATGEPMVGRRVR
jgi:hypothetical protein